MREFYFFFFKKVIIISERGCSDKLIISLSSIYLSESPVSDEKKKKHFLKSKRGGSLKKYISHQDLGVYFALLYTVTDSLNLPQKRKQQKKFWPP